MEIEHTILSLESEKELVRLNYGENEFWIKTVQDIPIYNASYASINAYKFILFKHDTHSTFRLDLGLSSYIIRRIGSTIPESVSKEGLLKAFNQTELLTIFDAVKKAEKLIKFYVDEL